MNHADLFRRRRVLAGLGLLGLGLAGCDKLIELPGQGPPPTIYRLTPKSTFPDDIPRVSAQLVVEPPFASAALSTTRIALMPSPTRVDYYARAGWEDQAPLMIQTLLVESFENSGRIVSVGRQSIGLRSDFVLKTELREFQAEYMDGGRPSVRVRLNAKLVRMPDRSIIAATDIENLAKADSEAIDAVVVAFDEALGKVMRGVVVWTLRNAAARGS